MLLVTKNFDQRGNEVVEVLANSIMEGDSHITYEATRHSDTFIIFSLQSPDYILTKLIYIYAFAKSINKAR